MDRIRQYSRQGGSVFLCLNHAHRRRVEQLGNILKCPVKPHLDHIIPFNRELCGLHVYGNILVVSPKANKLKHKQPVEEFLKDEPEKLKKIQDFMKQSGFIDIYNKYNEELKSVSKNLYEQIRITIEKEVITFSSQNFNTSEYDNK